MFASAMRDSASAIAMASCLHIDLLDRSSKIGDADIPLRACLSEFPVSDAVQRAPGRAFRCKSRSSLILSRLGCRRLILRQFLGAFRIRYSDVCPFERGLLHQRGSPRRPSSRCLASLTRADEYLLIELRNRLAGFDQIVEVDEDIRDPAG